MSLKKDKRKQSASKTEMEMDFERAKNAKSTSVRLMKQLLQQKWKLVIICLSVILSSAFNLASPMVIGEAINQLFEGIKKAINAGTTFQVNYETMGSIILILLGLYFFSAVFSYLQQYIMASVSQTLSLTLRKRISEKMNRLPLKYYDKNKKGDILSRITNDLDKVADTLQEGLMQLISSVVDVGGAVILMLIISPVLTLIAIGTIIVSMIIATLISQKTQRYYAKNQKALGDMNGNIEEAFTGNLIIKAFNKEEDAIDKAEELNQALYIAGKNAQFATYAVNPIIRLINQIGYVLIAVQGAVSVLQGKISLGNIQAFFQYVNKASEPITQIAYVMNSMQGAIAAAERVFEILDEEEEIPELTDACEISEKKGNVSFEHVRFGYDNDNILMNDVNFKAKAGAKIAIVGPTGAGKTTLVNLLMRFYELKGGRILIDDCDIKKMNRSKLRSMLGMVLQDTWVFGGSIEENIAYSKVNATQIEIIQAAKAARADHFIRTLPEGYQTVLDDEATNISQGQKQLLTIARAILANPDILILDEATSSVDTRTELEIQKAMDTLMKGRTSFIIAHRLSTIRDADHILVMKNGTIIEQGTHTELMNQNSFYAELYNSQFVSKAV